MARLNKVQLIGNLGADAEVKGLSNGGKVMNLRIATTDRWKDKNGEMQSRTAWHSIVVYNETLMGLADQLRKGTSVFVEGELAYREWQGRDGEKRTSAEIVLQRYRGDLQLLDRRQPGDDRAGTRSPKHGAYGDDAHAIDDYSPYEPISAQHGSTAPAPAFHGQAANSAPRAGHHGNSVGNSGRAMVGSHEHEWATNPFAPVTSHATLDGNGNFPI